MPSWTHRCRQCEGACPSRCSVAGRTGYRVRPAHPRCPHTKGVSRSHGTAWPSGQDRVTQETPPRGRVGPSTVDTPRTCRRLVIQGPPMLLLRLGVIPTIRSLLPEVTVLVILPNSTTDLLQSLREEQNMLPVHRPTKGPRPC